MRADALDAAGTLLLDRGMGAFTFEAVAEAAGVSKTTLYKWWPSKGALALDGYFHAVESALTFPGTGDIEADPTTQLRADVDPRVLVDQLWDACCHRLLLPDLPVTEEFTRSLIDTLMRGVRA